MTAAAQDLATIAQVKADMGVTGSGSDTLFQNFVTAASDWIHAYCNRTFYVRTETRTFDVPMTPGVGYASPYASITSPRVMSDLWLDDDLISLTTLTNGDGAVITSAQYKLWPYNIPPKQRITLLPTSGTVWNPSSSGEYIGAITVAGSWGYCDRAATDAWSVRVVSLTNQACKEIAKRLWERRSFEAEGQNSFITPDGVVVRPADVPKSALLMLAPFVRHATG